MLHATLLPSLLLLGTAEPAAPFTSYEPLSAAPLAVAPRFDDEHTFRYSYLEVGATRFDAENLDDEADTYYGEVSFDIFHLVNVFLGYENLSTDFQNLDTDIFRLGAGLHYGLTEFFDVTGDVAWLYSKLDSDTIDEDSNGTQLRVGGRWMVLDADAFALEVFGRGISINIDDSFYSDDSATGFDAGLRVHFLSALSVAGAYTKVEDDDSVGLSLRLSF